MKKTHKIIKFTLMPSSLKLKNRVSSNVTSLHKGITFCNSHFKLGRISLSHVKRDSFYLFLTHFIVTY